MMKKSNKKGFTMVELIIVIALIAILASVLIPTFANLINKANDSAYQQERTNQMIKDEIEKIDQGKVYMSWEDLEEAIAKALAEKGDDDLADKIIAIIGDLGKTSTGLTDEQLTKILDAIANKKFSDTQVKVILEGVHSGNTGLTEQQIADILAKLPQTGITEDDLKAAIAAVLGEQSGTINAAVQAILDKLSAPLTEDKIREIVAAILEKFKPAGPVGIAITAANYTSVFADNPSETNFYLTEDLDNLTTPWTVISESNSEMRTLVIDLCNHTVAQVTDGANNNTIVIGKNSNVTLKNGYIKNPHVWSENDNNTPYAVVGYNNVTITLDNIIITGNGVNNAGNCAIGCLNGQIVLKCYGSSINGFIFAEKLTGASVLIEGEGTYMLTSEMWNVGIPGSDPNVTIATGYSETHETKIIDTCKCNVYKVTKD